MDRLEETISNFDLLDEWEDRYRYIIELGRDLDPLPEADHNESNKVRGCASQVWITSDLESTADGPILTFRGDSDALIVKGLIAIAFMLFSGKTATEILETDAHAALKRIGLSEHLTPQRSNGFASMIERIKKDAYVALQASSSAAIPGR